MIDNTHMIILIVAISLTISNIIAAIFSRQSIIKISDKLEEYNKILNNIKELKKEIESKMERLNNE